MVKSNTVPTEIWNLLVQNPEFIVPPGGVDHEEQTVTTIHKETNRKYKIKWERNERG